MPSTYWDRVGVVLAALIVAYAVVVAQNVLLGIFLAAVLYLVTWLVVRVSPGNPLDDVTRERRLATGAVVLVVLAYAVVIAGSILLGILVAATVALVAWLTSPVGPVARWLDRV
jgi:predicted PurR-regulated permease PerM